MTFKELVELPEGKEGGILNAPMAQMETNEGVLTPEMLYAAIRAIESQPTPGPCTHLVSPSGMKRLSEGRQACCHTCGSLLGPYETQRPVE